MLACEEPAPWFPKKYTTRPAKLDSYDNILAGGDNGPMVVPGVSTDASALLVPKLSEHRNHGPDDAGFVVILGQSIDEGALDN
ncbi:MAG: hypothetical protein WBM75_03750 [Polyangiales bacterium]|jgi:hypothetical protein